MSYLSERSSVALKGQPSHLEYVEHVEFGVTPIDFLLINTPPACNYRCEKCFTWANKNPQKDFVGTEKMLEIIHEGKRLGAKQVAILGEGEPLLFKDFKLIISEIHALGMIPLIATNGSLLTREMVDFLFSNNVSVAISLDTLDRDEYARVLGGAADLNKFKKNVEYARKVFAKDIQVVNGIKVHRLCIHMTVNAKTYKNVARIQEFCGEDIYFSTEHIAKVGNALDNPDIYGDDETYAECQRVSWAVGRPMVVTQTPRGRDVCCYFYYGLAIGHDGQAMLDTHAVETKGLIGNVNEKSLEELIANARLLRDKFCSTDRHYCLIRDDGYHDFVQRAKEASDTTLCL